MLKFWKKFRTPILGVISVTLLVGSAVLIFDVPVREIVEFLIASASVVAIVIVCAMALGFVINRLRH